MVCKQIARLMPTQKNMTEMCGNALMSATIFEPALRKLEQFKITTVTSFKQSKTNYFYAC